MTPSSYRRSRLLEPASLIPWSDPVRQAFPIPAGGDPSRGPRRVRRSWVPRHLTRPGDRRGGHLQGLHVLRLRRQGGSVPPRTRVELERLFACVGPFPIPTETDPAPSGRRWSATTRTNRTRLASHKPRRDHRRSRRFTTPAAHPRLLVDQRGARRPRHGCIAGLLLLLAAVTTAGAAFGLLYVALR